MYGQDKLNQLFKVCTPQERIWQVRRSGAVGVCRNVDGWEEQAWAVDQKLHDSDDDSKRSVRPHYP